MTCRLIGYRLDRFSIIRQRGTPGSASLPAWPLKRAQSDRPLSGLFRSLRLRMWIPPCARARDRRPRKLVNVIAPEQRIAPAGARLNRSLASAFDARYRPTRFLRHQRRLVDINRVLSRRVGAIDSRNGAAPIEFDADVSRQRHSSPPIKLQF